MKKSMLALLAILFGIGLFADNLLTKSGKLYVKYTIDGPSIKGLVIFHESGAATIPYCDLPDDLRVKYSKDEDRANAELKSRENKLKELEQERIEAEKRIPVLVTKSGKRYRNYLIQKAIPGGVVVSYDKGEDTIPYGDMPDEIRGKYSQQEKIFLEELEHKREEEARITKRIEEDNQLSKIAHGARLLKIMQIIDSESALVIQDNSVARADSRFYGGSGNIKDNIFFLTDFPTKGYSDGDHVPSNDTQLYHRFNNIQFSPSISYHCIYCGMLSPFFRKGEKINNENDAIEWKSVHEKELCGAKKLTMWKTGTYSYIDTMGAKRTIPKYTYNRSVALKAISE